MEKIINTLKIRTYLFLGVFLFVSSGYFVAYAVDLISVEFSPQQATSSGSNSSVVSFSTGGTMTGTTSYMNKDNDSTTIGNYFKGYYYDSQFGFFKLDWSNDTIQNVHIASSTDKCPSGYGYELGGYGYSEAAGFIQFDYNNDVYVYYCEFDQKLHGYAYSEHIGFQSFEGISFDVISLAQNNQTLLSGNDPFFVNNSSMILLTADEKKTDIQGEIVSNKEGQEAVFYIVK